MRSARFELGSGGGPSGHVLFPAIPGEVPRPTFLHQERQITTATQIPGEKLESVSKKTPLMQPAKRFSREHQTKLKHRLPQARCFFLPASISSCLLQQRAGYRLLRQFIHSNSNRAANSDFR